MADTEIKDCPSCDGHGEKWQGGNSQGGRDGKWVKCKAKGCDGGQVRVPKKAS